jgi:hypothetical protein
MRIATRIAFALVALLTATACHNTTTPAATTPTVSRTTDTFTGTVAVGGADTHSFTVAATGNVDVTLTSATPSVVMGVSVGTPGTDRCIAVAGGSTQTAAGSSVQLSGIASPGTMCVDVHDAGGQPAPVSYTVTVTHP